MNPMLNSSLDATRAALFDRINIEELDFPKISCPRTSRFFLAFLFESCHNQSTDSSGGDTGLLDFLAVSNPFSDAGSGTFRNSVRAAAAPDVGTTGSFRCLWARLPESWFRSSQSFFRQLIRRGAVKEKGVVKWFNGAKGYGFIQRSTGEDVFVHFSAIQADGYRSLNEGESVEFELQQGPKGLNALEVTRPE
jgi:CspA family cold shock protein